MDLTPKQQTTELIRQAQNILIVTGREPNNDQLASAVGLHAVLTKLGKVANVVITDRLPKLADVLDTSMVARDMSGVRDFIISIDMKQARVDKVRYDVIGDNSDRLDVTITPAGGNFDAKHTSFSYGAYQFDLVIALGVPSLSRMDRLFDENPTIFDGLHLINIDYHRINDNFGSVNLVDTSATCVAEILISTIESLGQGMMDAPIATAFLGSFMSSTANFTAPSTTAKALTIAAQMISAGAKQQEIVRALASTSAPARQSEPSKVYSKAKDKEVVKPTTLEEAASAEPKEEPEHKTDGVSEEVIESNEQPGSKKNSKTLTNQNSTELNPVSPSQAKASDHSLAESKDQQESELSSAPKSPLDLN